MEFLEYLICQRVYTLINELQTILSPYLVTPIYEMIDVDKCIYGEKLFCRINFNNVMRLIIREAYSLRDYQLKIIYNYTLLSAEGSPLFSYDNFPHHPHLPTFPHHKHFYPKSKHKPISFSGNLTEALQEIRWWLKSHNSLSQI